MQPTDNTGFLLQRLAFVLGRQSDQVLREQLGIGYSQFKILMSLGWNPYVRQRVIATMLGQTEAGVSRQVKLLKEQGYLVTRINPRSRREHITVPTPKGERLTQKALELLNNYHAPMFARLSDKQNERLHEALTIMHDYACRDLDVLDTDSSQPLP